MDSSARSQALTDEDRDLLQKLSRVGNILGAVVTGILEDSISREEQIGFVYWLADAAEAMRARAERTHEVIEGSVVGEMTSSIEPHDQTSCRVRENESS